MKILKRLLFGKTWKGSVARTAMLLIICLTPFGYHYQPIWIDGISMEPTYDNGQWTLMQRERSFDKDWVPDRFDVIVVWSDEYEENLCKRVIGLPGEVIRIQDGKIYVNDNELIDTFGKGKITYFEVVYAHTPSTSWLMVPMDPITFPVIKPGEVWVIGDNRDDSVYGHFPINKIRGKIVLY